MRRISRSVSTVVVAAGLLTAAAHPALAQPTGAVTFALPLQGTSLEDGSDQVVGGGSGSGAFEHWFAGDQARVFYEVSLDRFRTTEAFDTWLHNAGAARTFTRGRTSLSAGAAVFRRANSGSWADAGFAGANLQVSADRTLSRGTLSGAYNVYRRSFSDAPSLSQSEQHGTLRALANLPSRTTVIGALAFGWKRYDGDSIDTLVEVPAWAGPGRGAGRGLAARSSEVIQATGQPVVRTLWTWSARVAQSLDDRTGVWLEREERRASGAAPPALVWTPPLFYDDGVYDDPYVVEAMTWRAGARHAFAGGHDLVGSLGRSGRLFDGLAVLDDSGAAIGMRADTLWRRSVDAEIVLRSPTAIDLVLLVGYGYIRNTSNDPLGSYRAHIGSLGLSFRF